MNMKRKKPVKLLGQAGEYYIEALGRKVPILLLRLELECGHIEQLIYSSAVPSESDIIAQWSIRCKQCESQLYASRRFKRQQEEEERQEALEILNRMGKEAQP